MKICKKRAHRIAVHTCPKKNVFTLIIADKEKITI